MTGDGASARAGGRRPSGPGTVDGTRAAPAWDDLILVARIARPHGLRGEVILDLETDFPEERFQPGNRLQIERAGRVEALVVGSVWFQRRRPVVLFEGVGSIEDAEPLVGLELRITPEEMAPLPAGVYYHADLVGCRVESVTGALIGEVRAVEGSGAACRLVVDAPEGDELIPLADPFCRVIDTVARRIVIAPPDGLLGLNETARSRRERRERRP